MNGSSSRFLARSRLSVLPVITVAHLAVCLACVQALSAHFYYSRRVVLLHVSLVAGVVALSIASVAYAIHRRWLTNAAVPRMLLSVAAAIAASLLGLLYVGELIGNYFWGDNLNYQLVRDYAAFALPNRAPFFIPLWLHAAVLGMAGLLFGGYWTCSNTVLSSIQWSVRIVRQSDRRGRLAWLAGAAVLGVGYAAGVSSLALSMRQNGLLRSEPIVGFFFDSNSPWDFGQYAGERIRTADGAAVRAAYPRGQPFDRKNVVLIVIDSLRADHMSVYGYGRATTPFLDTLFATGRLRRVGLALSTCAETNCGIMSILASRPLAHLTEENFSIDQLLRDQGYDVYRILSGNHDWHGLRAAFGDEQTMTFDSTNSQHYAVNDDRVLFEGLEHVPSYSGRPAFFQFHLMSAHSIGVKHDAYRRFQPSAVRLNLHSIRTGEDRQALTNAYDNGVLEADATIAELFEQLQKKGYLTNSMVVIVADHGEGLGDRGPLDVGHVNWLYQEHMGIPLLIYDEAGVAYRNLSLARQVDIAPTIVDRLGLATPSSWEGHSLLDATIAQYSYHESGSQWERGTRRWHWCSAVVDHVDRATYKYLRCGSPPHEELYDLAANPAETHDLIAAADPSLLDDLRSHLRDYLLQVASPPIAQRTSR